jgi:hypothetical protein
VLLLVVPVVSYVSGWNSGAGVRRVVVAEVGLDGQRFRLWRGMTHAGETEWCAEPLSDGPAPRHLDFQHDSGNASASFDAGQFCAWLPALVGQPHLATG